MRFLIAIALLLSFLPCLGQGPQVKNEAVIEKMKEVHFLVGEWKGEGWSMIGGRKETSIVEEKVVPKAAGTVLAVEGVGKDSRGNVVHNAFAVIYADPSGKGFKMRSFLQNGKGGEFGMTQDKGVIVWTIPSERTVRYTIKLDAQGRWHEIGEVDMGEGKWYQFMEMTLKKVK